ncbi:MAG: hypothetical protein IT436_07070 [Phycisphaerales bacterium]|nr:hypothetical protein [Phycisphaerales bacterium]
MRSILIALPLAALAAGFAPARPAPSPAQPLPIERPAPSVMLYGPESSIRERRFERIRDQPAWNALWAEHAKDLGDRAAQGWLLPPQIDFTTFEVIAFFRGPATNTSGEIAELVELGIDQVWLRFDSITYQTASSFNNPDPSGGAVRCHPYGLWVIRRTDKPVILEENVQNLKSEPPVWREQHRFPPAADGC